MANNLLLASILIGLVACNDGTTKSNLTTTGSNANSQAVPGLFLGDIKPQPFGPQVGSMNIAVEVLSSLKESLADPNTSAVMRYGDCPEITARAEFTNNYFIRISQPKGKQLCSLDNPKQFTLTITKKIDGKVPVVVTKNLLPVLSSYGNTIPKAQVNVSFPFYMKGDDIEKNDAIEKIVVNDGAIQRSRVDKIVVYFKGQVSNLDASAFKLERQSDPKVEVEKLIVDSKEVDGKTVALLTFDGKYTTHNSLNDGLWELTVKADVITASGLKMDKDFKHETHSLFGDSNGDRIVDDGFDYDLLKSAYGSPTNPGVYKPHLDANQNGIIDNQDLFAFRLRFINLAVQYAELQRSKVSNVGLRLVGTIDSELFKSAVFVTNSLGKVVTLSSEFKVDEKLDLNVSSERKQSFITMVFSGEFTEFASLKDGTYTISLDTSKIKINGLVLKRSLVTQTVKRLFGDANGDGKVVEDDMAAFRLSFNKASSDPEFKSYFDFNSDDHVTNGDLAQFRLRYTGE